MKLEDIGKDVYSAIARANAKAENKIDDFKYTFWIVLAAFAVGVTAGGLLF